MATKLQKYIITNTIYYFQYSIASTFLDIIIRIHAKQLSWYSCLLQKVWCTPTCWHFKSTYTQHRQLDVYTCSTSLYLYIFLILQVKLTQHCGTMYTLKSWSYESKMYWYKLPMKKKKNQVVDVSFAPYGGHFQHMHNYISYVSYEALLWHSKQTNQDSLYWSPLFQIEDSCLLLSLLQVFCNHVTIFTNVT